MLRIFTAPLTNPQTRTLQASGETWELLLMDLDEGEYQELMTALVKALPKSFLRTDIVRATLPRKIAAQILTIAGLSG